MSSGKTPSRPNPFEVRDFTRSDIERAIEKLHRRIDDVNHLDPRQVPFDDAKVRNLERNIRETIREMYGSQSPEFRDHEDHRIWHGGYNITDSEDVRQRKFSAGIPQTVTMLEGLTS